MTSIIVMKKCAIAAIAALALTACTTAEKTASGTGVGAAVGAIVGAVFLGETSYSVPAAGT